MNWMQKDVQTSAQMEIAWQCAPVLTGVKPSNILTLKNVSEKEVAESLKEMGISYSMLCDGGVRKVWLQCCKRGIYQGNAGREGSVACSKKRETAI